MNQAIHGLLNLLRQMPTLWINCPDRLVIGLQVVKKQLHHSVFKIG